MINILSVRLGDKKSKVHDECKADKDDATEETPFLLFDLVCVRVSCLCHTLAIG